MNAIEFLPFSFAMFVCGLLGVFIRGRSFLLLLLSVELMFLASWINFLGFAYIHHDKWGYVAAWLIFSVSAAEVAVALALIVVYYQTAGHVQLDRLGSMKE